MGENIVPHPRYGAAPIPSGHKVPESEIRKGHWQLSRAEMFPETVIPAEPARQNYADYPRLYYVDMRRTCQTCQRPFIFFAREQQYWFETLHFYVDADCLTCPACRRISTIARRRLRRYVGLRAKPAPSRKESMFLIDDAIWLVEHDVLRNLNGVGAVKNRVAKTIAEYPGLQTLAAVLAAARAKAGTDR